MHQDQPYDIHIKVLMLGDSGTGKTSLLLRYCDNTFSPSLTSTLGIDFKIKHITVEDLKTKLQIWDTAGQERFRAITTSYFKGSNAVMLVYSVTDRDTFDNINKWCRQIRELGDLNTNILLVGNKCDEKFNRVVSNQEAQEMAKKHNVTYMEVSAKEDKEGTSVEDAFTQITLETKRRMLGEIKTTNGINLSMKKEKAACC